MILTNFLFFVYSFKQPVVQETAQACEGPDQEADQTPAQPFREDTEGDTQTGEGEHADGQPADGQTEE